MMYWVSEQWYFYKKTVIDMIMPGITYWRYVVPYMVSNKYIID